MIDYKPVQDALADGADPAMLCATCPWDRNCVSPPGMTRAEVDKRIQEATEKDRREAEIAQAQGRAPGMPVGSLMTALIVGGRDTSAGVCPVFALRLRSGAGRKVADAIRGLMQGWDDES